MAERSSPTNRDSVSSISTICDNENWLEKRPLLSVVCSVIRTNRWHQLGIQLNVDETSLNEIDRDNPSTDLKKTKMFEEWLKTQPNATNRQLLNALRLKVIGEDTMAEEYEERIKTSTDTLTRNDSQAISDHPVHTESQSHTDMAVSSMVHRASQVLTVQALQLQEKYHKLLEQIQDLAQYSNVELIKTKLKSILKEKSLYQSHTIAPYCTQINTITTVDEAFQFLVDNNFVGYLNFQLLKELSSKRICGEAGSRRARDKVSKYEKCYRKFIEEPTFGEVIQVFDENPHLNPSTIIGLPIIVVTLTMEWKKRNKKDLEEWLPFLKRNRALLQSMGYKCILITYAVFPIDLLNIMDFLNDPNNIKTLKDNGISIETPSHTLEIEKLLREAQEEGEEPEEDREESPDSDITDEHTHSLQIQQLTIEVNSLKSQLVDIQLQLQETKKKNEKQRLADRNYWSLEMSRLRENYETEFRNFQQSCLRQLEAIDDSNTKYKTENDKKMITISDDVDDLTSEVQMINRELSRHAKIRATTGIRREKVKIEDIKKLSTQFEASLEGSLEKRSESTDSGLDSAGLNSRASSISFGNMSLPRNV